MAEVIELDDSSGREKDDNVMVNDTWDGQGVATPLPNG